MQLIITDSWVAKTRAIHINAVKATVVLILILILFMSTSAALYHWVFLSGARMGWSILPSSDTIVSKDETAQKDRFLRENLDALARRMGEMQAKVLQLESLGDRISGLAGVPAASPKRAPGKGGVLVLSQPLSMVELEATLSGLERTTRERADILTMIESRLLDKKIKGLMMPTRVPVEAGVIGSPFGFRIDPITGQSALHTGLDFQAAQGTPILAAAGGVIVTQEFHSAYGNMLEIDHGNGLMTRYAHILKTVVKKGDLIKRGQLIAEVGTTGRSTGPHLHFEVLVNGIMQDPQKFLNAGAAVVAAQSRINLGAETLSDVTARGAAGPR